MQEAGQLEDALERLQQVWQTFAGTEDTLSEGDRQRQADILNQISNIYLDLEEYDLGLST